MSRCWWFGTVDAFVVVVVVTVSTPPLPLQQQQQRPRTKQTVPWYHLRTDHDDQVLLDNEMGEEEEEVVVVKEEVILPPRLRDNVLLPPPPSSSQSQLQQPSTDEAEFPTPNDHLLLPEGLPKGFYMVQQYTYLPNDTTRQKLLDLMTTATTDTTDTSSNTSSNTSNSSSVNSITRMMNSDRVHSLGLENVHNVTLPLALMMLDPITYPSFSRARKACRKGNVLVIRSGSNTTTTTTTTNMNRNNNTDHDVHDDDEANTTKFIGRVGHRVYTGDTVAIQARMGNGDRFAIMSTGQIKPPPFDVPVIYQDDHYALVNKPAGVVCYRQGSGSSGWLSIRAALPFVLDPPARGTYAVLRRPASVHRLDKPTSGLLCIVKTKPAMVHMSKQFHDRVVQKTYTAIVNGIPEENSNAWITSQEAVLKYGVDTNGDTDPDDTTPWQLIDAPLDNQHAVTLWRVRQYVPSLRARDGTITLVECQPQTGRYHQLRRHMAWVANRAMVGDAEYDGNHPSAVALRGNGLFLCATGITHEHPYYNTLDGRLEWNRRYPTKVHEEEDSPEDNNPNQHHSNNTNNSNRNVLWYNAHTDKVMVSASIEAPTKFRSLLQREGERYRKFHAVTVP